MLTVYFSGCEESFGEVCLFVCLLATNGNEYGLGETCLIYMENEFIMGWHCPREFRAVYMEYIVTIPVGLSDHQVGFCSYADGISDHKRSEVRCKKQNERRPWKAWHQSMQQRL